MPKNNNNVKRRIREAREGGASRKRGKKTPLVRIDDELQREAGNKPDVYGNTPKTTKHIVPSAAKGKYKQSKAYGNATKKEKIGFQAIEGKLLGYIANNGYTYIGEEQGQPLLDALVSVVIRRAHALSETGKSENYYANVLHSEQFDERIFATFMGAIGRNDAFLDENLRIAFGEFLDEAIDKGYVIRTSVLEEEGDRQDTFRTFDWENIENYKE